jgi:uncharacterized protein (TIGR02996 family)
MTPEDGFLADICEHPEEDAPRLVYADWLDDHGEPDRAEFIRVQVELASLRPGRRREELEEQERVFLEEHEAAWLGPLRAWLSRWEFRRGLVEEVALKAQTLLKHAGTIFRLTPVRHAEVRKAGRLGRDLAGCPQLARLNSLRVYGLYTQDSVSLIGSPHLGGLTSLALPQASLTDAGVGALAGSPLLARLTWLDLTCNGIHDAGVTALAASPHASRLERLDLSRNGIGQEGAAALAASTSLGGLRSLRLGGYGVGQREVGLLKARFGERVEFC